MHISVFDIFKIGIGPSSSHTVGPMKAARAFALQLQHANQLLTTARIEIALYGSLALTGKGHGTDKAIILGLLGEEPHNVNPADIPNKLAMIRHTGQITLLGRQLVPFRETKDLLFHYQEILPRHTNGMRFSAFAADGSILQQQVYYSTGGGFIATEQQLDQPSDDTLTIPYPFSTAAELLALCQRDNLRISELMLANERIYRSDADIEHGLSQIITAMEQSIHAGCHNEGILPGGLEVRRRAPGLYQKLTATSKPTPHHLDVMNWVNVYAMAVNEENAAGGRIVTAPTNGAAGIIPAVLQYYKDFCQGDAAGQREFLLTAAAIAILYKLQASISGAEVGCQGEVGVACSMAAGALAAVCSGSLEQIENAAEIGMEHNLGLPCDPPKGLVQIPCIERNAMGAVKAINAAQLALAENGQHKVSLDTVIKTMRQIGHDMKVIYKETSLGGLAVNVPEC